MESLSLETARAEEARIQTVYAERQRNDVLLGFTALAGRRVAPHLTVVPTPPLNQALERM